MITRFPLLALTLAFFSVPVFAQTSYCATNSQKSVAETCFGTYDEAEAFVLDDTSPDKRRRFLEPAGPGRIFSSPLLTGLEDWQARAVPAGEPIATWYVGNTSIRSSVLLTEPDDVYVPELQPYEDVLGAPSLPSLMGHIRNRDGTTGGSFTGGFVARALGGSVLNRPDPSGLSRRQIHQWLNVPQGQADFDSGYRKWSVWKFHRVWCPLGMDSVTTDGYCKNSETGRIRKYEGTNPLSCPSTHYPCVPGTGAKELHEVDFDWGSWSFTRHYSSVRGMPASHALGTVWSHTFIAAMRAVDTEMITVDERGHADSYKQITPGVNRGDNEGKIVRKSTVGSVTTYRLLQNAGREDTFDSTGRLIRIWLPNDPMNSVELSYCDATPYQQGLCVPYRQLWRVTNKTGRYLEFVYSDYRDIGPIDAPTAVPSRLLGIRDDTGAWRVQYQYDSQHRLSAVVHEDESVRSYVYGEPQHLCVDSQGTSQTPCPATGFPNHVTGIIAENGLRLSTYRYDRLGRVTSSQWAGGAYPEKVAYTGTDTRTLTTQSGETIQISYGRYLKYSKPTGLVSPRGNQTIAYDANGKETLRTDRRGLQTKREHDTYYQTAVTQAFGTADAVRTETDWNTANDRPTESRVKNALGVLISKRTLAYNTRAQVISDTLTDAATNTARTTQRTYCEAAEVASPGSTCPVLGLPKTIDGPRTDVADVTTFAYRPSDDVSGCTAAGPCHRKGDLWQVINAAGHVSEILRNDRAGRAAAMKDANGVVTEMTYHPRGWLLSRTVKGAVPAEDATTTYAYDAAGQLERITAPDGDWTQFEYDDAQRLKAIEDALGNRIDYSLDAAGQRTAENTKDASGTLTRSLSREFDALGRLDLVRDAYARATDVGYDANDNQTTQEDALGRETQQEYDALDRLKRTLQDVGGLEVETRYAYDVQSRLTRVTDPKGLHTDYAYNGLGDLTQLTSPDTGVTLYTQDAAGNRTTQTDARGITATYTYDALNRLVAIAYPTSSLDVAFAYDEADGLTGCDGSFPKGRLTRMTDASGSTTYCYDRRGNVTAKTQLTGAVSLTVGYEWTLGDRLSRVIYPGGAAVVYSRDATGRIATVTRRVGLVDTALVEDTDYAPFGPLTRVDFGGGQQLQFAYDKNYGIEEVSGAGLSLDFELDAVGNLTHLLTPTDERAYGYDALSRLTRVDDENAQALEAFTYDATGNRLTKGRGAVTQNYTYLPTSHRLASVAGIGRSYDAMGSLIDRGDGWSFEYNDAARLSQARLNGTPRMSARYSGRGERVAKTDSSTGEVSYFLYDEGGRLLAEYLDTASAPQREYLWLDERLVGVFVNAGPYAGALLRVASDHLGTPRALVGADASVVWSHPLEGAVFGEDPAQQDPDGDGQPLVFNLRFPGQYFDGETGLHYNYFRDYEPGTGRYLQSDPMGLMASVSSYSYVDSNPMAWVDPQGLSRFDKFFGLSKEFWNWYHRKVKKPGDPNLTQDEARALFDEWNDIGKPGPGGGRRGRRNQSGAANVDLLEWFIPWPLTPSELGCADFDCHPLDGIDDRLPICPI